ncbi:hypothetical protein HPB49_020151 [Dermacentor silvarum]|uniref:Uncharacterized protein n=1 Tax=Dermacentor silvarum TaxID=543639 RepID=A0ACB8D7I9_DERSI|nr:hypothetical protein HPB49_020151 [Dermacentor silvarum]
MGQSFASWIEPLSVDPKQGRLPHRCPCLQLQRLAGLARRSSDDFTGGAECPSTAAMAAASMQVEDFDEEVGWKTVSSRRARKGGRVSPSNAASQQGDHAGAGQVSARCLFSNIMNRGVKASRMPPMPQEHIKIVLRGRGGLNFKKTSPTSVGKAITEATGLSVEETMDDVICPNVIQNILVASTPLKENTERYVRIKSITVAGKAYEVNAYETAPSDTCKGVIRNVNIADGPAALERNIWNDRNPLALGVQRINNSESVIIVFDGLLVPNFVRYGSTLPLPLLATWVIKTTRIKQKQVSLQLQGAAGCRHPVVAVLRSSQVLPWVVSVVTYSYTAAEAPHVCYGCETR